MTIRIPGDKSISQRALLLASLTSAESRISGVLPAADPRSTADGLRRLGAQIPQWRHESDELRIRGCGLRTLQAPAQPLDLGNSGTGTRLLMGVLAAQPFTCVLDGDASLRSRPMERVTRPLSLMGAEFEWLQAHGRLPVRVHGRALQSLDYDLPVASAQLKSSLLLAGLCGGVPVQLSEPGASRDHTERMLRGMGVSVLSHVQTRGVRIELRDPPDQLPGLDLDVPGDLSSAAFFLLAALLGVTQQPLELPAVGVNPTRSGVLDLLARMGGRVGVENPRTVGGEPIADLVAEPARLQGIEVDAADVTSAIDEIPAIAVAAARAEGRTVIRGAGELRVKETDRIRALVTNLRAVGVTAEEFEDGLEVVGTDAPLRGRVDAFDDHRIAMAFGVLAAQPGNQIEVDGRSCVEVSFPDFWSQLEGARDAD